MAEKTDKNTYVAHVTMSADRGMFGTSRSVLEDKQDGKLTFSWEQGDLVYLTDTENQPKGKLEVVSVDESGKHAILEGDIIADVYNGEKEYVFYFFGNNTKDEVSAGNPISEKKYDFSEQDGLLSSLSDDDLLIEKAKVNFVEGAGSVHVSFKRQFAYAHYKLVYNNEVLDTKNVEITISADNLAPTASVGFTNGDMVPGAVSPFTVTPSANPAPDEEGGFYVALVPNNEETTLTFTCTVNGVNFIGTRTLSKLEKNDFYRLSNGFGAIPIEMNPARQYRVFYHINITDIDESDDDGPRVCTSLPDIVSGAEAASYRVLNFTEPILDTSKDIKNEANFTDGYLYEFLGWGTEESAAKSWASENLGVKYEAKENESDSEPAENATINLTELATKVTVENGVTYHDLHLYAKGSVMQYKLECVYEKRDGEGVAWGAAGKNRLTGWCEIKLTGGVTIPNKKGYEFMGWSRRDGNKKLVNEDSPIQWESNVRVYKEDSYGTWNPNYTGKDGLNRPIKGLQTLKLYPVYKEIPPVSLPGYGGGTLE